MTFLLAREQRGRALEHEGRTYAALDVADKLMGSGDSHSDVGYFG